MRYRNVRSKPPIGKKPPTVLALVVRRTNLVAPPSMASTSWKRKFGFVVKREAVNLLNQNIVRKIGIRIILKSIS